MSRDIPTCKQSGTTLIELITVLLIAGIVYGLVIRLDTEDASDNATLISTAKQIRSTLKTLQTKAIQTQRLTKCVFIADTSYATTYIESDSSDVWGSETKTLSWAPGITVASSTLADMQIVFDTTGRPYEDDQTDLPSQSRDLSLSQSRDIVIQTGDGTSKTISISPETGYISFP